jgi:hypothetical protein
MNIKQKLFVVAEWVVFGAICWLALNIVVVILVLGEAL